MTKHTNLTEDLILSFSEKCEKHIEQIHTKQQETLEFMLTTSRGAFSLKRPI